VVDDEVLIEAERGAVAQGGRRVDAKDAVRDFVDARAGLRVRDHDGLRVGIRLGSVASRPGVTGSVAISFGRRVRVCSAAMVSEATEAAAAGEPDETSLARRIIARAPESDAAAEAALCRRLGPRIRLFGLKHLRDAAAAKDLMQDVLVLLLTKL